MSQDKSTTIVASVDALFGQEILSTPSAVSKPRSLKQLKQFCHRGLPPQLRCSVWITSVMRVVNPNIPVADAESYGTTSLTTSIEATWQHALNATFANGIHREDVSAPDFGLHKSHLEQLIQNDYREWNPAARTASARSIPAEGARSWTGILCTVHQVLGIEYCPPLPDISELKYAFGCTSSPWSKISLSKRIFRLLAAAILLTHMPESYVFATIREMINDSSHFLPSSQKAYYAWCKTYAYFVERLFPSTFKVMEKCGALDPHSGLDPIFKRFFVTLLKREVNRLS